MFRDLMDFARPKLSAKEQPKARLLPSLVLALMTSGVAAMLSGCGQNAPKLPPPPSPEPNTSSQGPSGPAPVAKEETAKPAQPPQTEQEKKPNNDDERTRSLSTRAKPPEAAPPAPVAAAPPPPAPSAPATTVKPSILSERDPAGSSSAPPAPGAPAIDHTVKPVSAAGGGATEPTPAAAPDKTFDVIPVFYGTDRAVEPNPNRLAYGAERGKKLQLGRALITVPTSHKVPNIERPWVVEIPYFKVKVYEEKEDTAKHFTMQEISALTKEQMLAFVKERLAKSQKFKDHAFVFVHGFNTAFDYSLYRTAQIANDMKFDGASFVYSWPSGGKVASYTYDRGSAEQAEPHLAEFLDLVIKESGAKSISLIAHSMGNELLLRVLERMRTVAPKGVVISQVILCAPDVDRDKFDNIAREITKFSKGVTLYAASNDKALGYSARFWGGIPRAGDVPASGPLIVPGVDTIDVTAVSTDSLGLNHSGYAENNALLADIAQLLETGQRPPDKRIPSLETVKTAAGDYWRYPAAH